MEAAQRGDTAAYEALLQALLPPLRDFVRRLVRDPNEIEEARWVSAADLVAALRKEADFHLPPPLAIAHHLVIAWLDARGLRP